MYNITSTGPVNKKRDYWLGPYLRMNNVTRNNRPVWQRGAGNKFIFYNDRNYWVFDNNYSVNGAGFISTVGQHLERPPSTAWKLHNGTAMVEDSHLEVLEYEGKILNT